MRIIKLDLSEKKVTNELLQTIMNLALYDSFCPDQKYNLTHILRSATEIICSSRDLRLYIESNGNIFIHGYDGIISVNNLSEIMDLILDSQWIDPKAQLPEEDCSVIVKMKYGIIFATYRTEFEDFIISTHNMVIDNLSKYRGISGWLFTDNVKGL
jgi:hypothetical protein